MLPNGKRKLTNEHDGMEPKRVKTLAEGTVDDDLLGELEDLYSSTNCVLDSMKPAITQKNIPRRNFHQPHKMVPVPRYGKLGLGSGKIDFQGRISRERNDEQQIDFQGQTREAPPGYVPVRPLKRAVALAPLSPASDDSTDNRFPLKISSLSDLPPPCLGDVRSNTYLTAPAEPGKSRNKMEHKSTAEQMEMQYAKMQQAQIQQARMMQQAQMKQMMMMQQQAQMKQYYQMQMMQQQQQQTSQNGVSYQHAQMQQMMQHPAYRAQMQQMQMQQMIQAKAAAIAKKKREEESTIMPPNMQNIFR